MTLPHIVPEMSLCYHADKVHAPSSIIHGAIVIVVIVMGAAGHVHHA